MKNTAKQQAAFDKKPNVAMNDKAKGQASHLVSKLYAVSVSPHLQKLIEKSPAVAKQFLPDGRELIRTPDEITDPIGDYPHMPIKGLVHRYPDRVLLKPTNICAAYCRYCFRRSMVGNTGTEKPLSEKEIEKALAYIREHDEIREVIFSGGDPLILSARRLTAMVGQIDAIEHINFIRFHTRAPISSPELVTDDLLNMLGLIKKTKIMVLHINHPDELTGEVKQAIANLAQSGAMLLSQSVLLRDINNDAAILADLFRALIGVGVKPYYLHHPDKAEGTSHFRVPLTDGMAIMQQLRGRISGICLPDYMLDIPKGFGKVPVTADYIECCGNGAYKVRDIHGKIHDYFD